MSAPLKVLIIGGYGTFGGRLVELIEDIATLEIVVAGRTLQKAEHFCASRGRVAAKLTPAAFERTGDVTIQLNKISPNIVVDASGPFQNYGAQTYALVEACIAQKIHYLDLADGSDFVNSIKRYDAAAREANIFVLSGVSSFPVLTAAVVDVLAHDMDDVVMIRGGIAPSPYAGIGKNVIQAIASYAGQKVTALQNSKIQELYPLTDSLRYTVAPPGRLPLRNTLFSLVDVPDLYVLADKWPRAHVWMGAGPVPEILHRVLNLFAWCVRIGLIKSLKPLANIMEFVISHVRWGEHRGGMFVEVTGHKEGHSIKRSWHMLAEGRDGPLIPSMAVQAIIKKITQGHAPKTGARSALDDINLQDYAQLFASRTIYMGTRLDTPNNQQPLYQDILGAAWQSIPPVIKNMHDIDTSAEAEGKGTVTRGTHPLARLICTLIGFPKSGSDVDVRVHFSVRNNIQKWERVFAGKRFVSYQQAGNGRNVHLVVERFGLMRFALALVCEGEKLKLVVRRWSVIGIAMPMWLCVHSESYESVDEKGRFCFNVRIWHPLCGAIIHYQGWLLRKA